MRADPISGHRREKLRERASSGKSWFGCYSPRVKPANPLLRLIPLLAVSAWLAGTTVQAAAPAPATGLAAIRVPEGFQVSLAAGGDLAPYAMFGARDDRGRLFLAESSGKNIKGLAMAQAPECRIRMLEDTDGDGVFDRSSVFVDRIGIPMGVLWHDGALFVASPNFSRPFTKRTSIPGRGRCRSRLDCRMS